MSDERKISEEELQAIHKEALERFEDVFNREKSQRELAIEDMRFTHAEDGQWEEKAIEKRKDRPRYTVNRVAGAIDQVSGDQRQNRTQIKVRATTGGTDDVAKVETGLIRNIEHQSDAITIYDEAFDETATCGYGGWRVLTQFSNDDAFEQDIVLAPIKSAASSLYLDPAAQKYDKRDGMYGFYIEDINEKKFKKDFPDAVVTDFNTTLLHTGSCSTWFRDNMVRVAEYWRVEMVDTEIALLSDGRVIDIKEEKQVMDELVARGLEILQTRKTQKRKIESFIMNGAEILKGPMPWAGKYIPLVPVFGRTTNIQGQEYVRGITRFAKDAQRIYNYAKSNEIETTALTPKDPVWITPTQAKGHEAKLRSFNTTNSPFMLYNADPESPGIPQRGGAPAVQQALIMQSQAAGEDIHATTGLFAPSMGNAPQLLSEKSVRSQAEKGERGVFVFTDNLHKSIKYTGDILVDLMPRIYDTQRVVRVLNFDGTAEDVEINAAAINDFNEPITDEQTGDQVIVNDLSRGKYETVVESGPAFSTLRQESAQQLIDLATGSPVFEQIATDLIAKNLSILESDELTKRVRKTMINQGIIEPTEEEIEELGLNQGPPEPSPEQVALLQNLEMQTANIMADIENTNADTDNKDAKTLQTKLQAQKVAVDALNTLMDAYKKQIESGIPFGVTEHQIKVAQEAIVSLSQEELVSGAVEQGLNQ